MTTTAQRATTPLLDPRYRWSTIGMVGLVFLAAFESLAVTTAMPTVSDELDGRSLYAVAFSGTLAAGVVSMVAAGIWADRRGPGRPLVGVVGLFALGLLVAGLAPSMEVLVAGRLLQGLGAGGLVVCLYLLVSAVYDDADRPRILGAFAAAWVVPSMIGPALAGLTTETVGWRWVFLGVVVLCVPGLLAVLPAVRAAESTRLDDATPAGDPRRRLAWAGLAAVAVLALDLAGRADGVLAVVTAVAALAVVALAVRPLVPPGFLVGRRGLPAIIAVRGAGSAAFLGSEIYLPYLLQERYDASATVAGLTLTTAALGWASASQVQGRLGDRLGDRQALRIGSPLVAAGLLATLAVAALGLPGWLLPLTWAVAGVGMGLQTPRVGVLVLGESPDDERAANTSAMALGDSVGAAVAIAVGGLAFSAAGAAPELAPFVAALSVTSAIALLGVWLSRRTRA
ncbi:MFS transporter [Nocardioides sp. C4-1]|uniref:MFS transporter n=1 Tax=Nocardioides sp. C4-1 TaxID=3151851 RepID=UPI0032650440